MENLTSPRQNFRNMVGTICIDFLCKIPPPHLNATIFYLLKIMNFTRRKITSFFELFSSCSTYISCWFFCILFFQSIFSPCFTSQRMLKDRIPVQNCILLLLQIKVIFLFDFPPTNRHFWSMLLNRLKSSSNFCALIFISFFVPFCPELIWTKTAIHYLSVCMFFEWRLHLFVL